MDGINVNLKNVFGSTALMIAYLKDHIEIVDKLLALDGIDVNDRYPLILKRLIHSRIQIVGDMVLGKNKFSKKKIS